MHDTTTSSVSLQEHMAHLSKLSTSKIRIKKTGYLGHVISDQEIRPGRKKIQAATKYSKSS